jgi:hypothetical protein
MTKDEALKMALHTLVLWDDRCRLRVIAAIKEALAQPAQEPTDIAALVEGMEVSIDVSTGEHDSNNRLFGTVTLAQENQGSKHGLILLVQEPTPNFKVSLVQELVTHTINSTHTAAVATDYYWIPIDEHTPRGVKLQLLGKGGVAQYSNFYGDPFWSHWAPLPKRRD